MKQIIVFIALIVLIIGFRSPVYACSGGGPTPLFRLLEGVSMVVKARVLDTDTYGQTGTVEIIDYLVGGGETTTVLVSQLNPVGAIYLLDDRDGVGGCDTLAPAFTLDEEVYLFLIRNADGSYRTSVPPDQFSYSTMVYRFPDPDSTALLITGNSGDINTPGTLTAHQVTETEFRAMVVDHGRGHSARLTGISHYPMPAPILITTTTGTSYLLPVDYGAPVLLEGEALRTLRRSSIVGRSGSLLGVNGCNVVGCMAYSPNGLDYASVTVENVVLISRPVPGEGFLFSWTNEAVVVWNENTLDFYTFRYPKYDMPDYPITLLASREINLGSQWVAQAAWSADGRLLAYSDAEGLWQLDVYSQLARLLVPVSGGGMVTVARYFSPNGRYLAITQDDERSTLDTVTGEILPDGTVSPDERYLLAYDTEQTISERSICLLIGSRRCDELGLGVAPLWTADNYYIITEYGAPHVKRFSEFGSRLGNGINYDYEPVTATYLLIRDAHELAIRDRYHTSIYNLGAFIEEEIVTAEWLPTLYFDNRTFGDTVVQRHREYLESLPPPEEY